MTGTAVIAEPPQSAAIRRWVATVLDDFLRCKTRAAMDLRMPAEVAWTLRDFLAAGGKRLRPLLCVIGWQAAGGHGTPAFVVKAAASLEMFHAFALIHDDVMDNSDSRRGAPTVHRRLARHQDVSRNAPSAERLGTSSAILIGDLALAWSDELLHNAGLTSSQLAAVLPLLHVMRTEVMYGQYLDVTAAGRPTCDVDRAWQIVRYKTAKYTIERPLHIGAALAGAPPAMHETLSAYALPLGEAFQLRDDILGVFGDPSTTGKPCLDDLRDGKNTVLIALALQRATPGQRSTLQTLLGNPELDGAGADRIRQVLISSGARDELERMINGRRAQAVRALDAAPYPLAATAALRQLAHTATARTS
ncbi:polyprenyl synthetase family protein [Streptomyces sp. LUP30]|uniref:polyprenyl synthetase family protein n=1 Tax=Streptomyces sp. LUP30 TaxID=1890285 RepID=UPI0008516AE4|nr:polyprenyl synthetase family protein [Streptomyces sp. LUP30]